MLLTKIKNNWIEKQFQREQMASCTVNINIDLEL